MKDGTPGEQVPVVSLVDSGADVCLFDAGYACAFGIDLEEREHAAGDGDGGVPYDLRKTEATFEPEGLSATTAAMFMDSSRVTGLLGREGFFGVHHIASRRDRNGFEIVPEGETE